MVNLNYIFYSLNTKEPLILALFEHGFNITRDHKLDEVFSVKSNCWLLGNTKIKIKVVENDIKFCNLTSYDTNDPNFDLISTIKSNLIKGRLSNIFEIICCAFVVINPLMDGYILFAITTMLSYVTLCVYLNSVSDSVFNHFYKYDQKRHNKIFNKLIKVPKFIVVLAITLFSTLLIPSIVNYLN